MFKHISRSAVWARRGAMTAVVPLIFLVLAADSGSRAGAAGSAFDDSSGGEPYQVAIDFSDQSSVLSFTRTVPHYRLVDVSTGPRHPSFARCQHQEQRKGASPATIGALGLFLNTKTGQRFSACFSNAPLGHRFARWACAELGMEVLEFQDTRLMCRKPGMT